jgi:hypothetical protein
MQLTSGRVSNFTLENFLYNIWLNLSITLLTIGIFWLYRYFRNDNETLKQKLEFQSRGLKKNFQTFSKKTFKVDSDHSVATESSEEDQYNQEIQNDF